MQPGAGHSISESLPLQSGIKGTLRSTCPCWIIVDPMSEGSTPESSRSPADPTAELHRAQGITANNATWDSLSKPDGDRTADDEEAMTQSAYAAAYHWARAARRGPENDARAEWLISRVWAVRRKGDLALHHADRCMTACVVAGLFDFDLAHAHESRARALACLGRSDEAIVARTAAAAVRIAENEDRGIVETDLASEPWFGL